MKNNKWKEDMEKIVDMNYDGFDLILTEHLKTQKEINKWLVYKKETTALMKEVLTQLIQNEFLVEVKKEIIEWIKNEHNHHSENCDCWDSECPFVNSIDLEKFIKSL